MARRQHRASHKPATAAASRGIREALAMLYDAAPVTPERVAQLQHALASPRNPPAQCALAFGEPEPT